MATAKDLRRMALALEGTSEAPHFDRAAFKVARIYVTLAGDGKTANFKFTPDEQEFKCMMAPDAFAPRAERLGQAGLDDGNAVGAQQRRPAIRARDGVAARDGQEAAAVVPITRCHPGLGPRIQPSSLRAS